MASTCHRILWSGYWAGKCYHNTVFSVRNLFVICNIWQAVLSCWNTSGNGCDLKKYFCCLVFQQFLSTFFFYFFWYSPKLFDFYYFTASIVNQDQFHVSNGFWKYSLVLKWSSVLEIIKKKFFTNYYSCLFFIIL